MTSPTQSSMSPDQPLESGGGVSLPSVVDRFHTISVADLPPDWHYESAVAQVEAIIAQIETGELELADIFEQFGRAVQQLQDCEAFLNHHRQQVDILVETLTDEGNG